MGLFSIILIVASLLQFSASDRQGDALYDMKLKLNATANQLADWNQNQVNPCTWNSVICDSNNNVVQVTLASLGFTGVLSPSIGELEYLNVLSLPGNNITGGIPEQFGNLSRLTSLDLENNLLVGPIPASLGKLSKLQLLILSQNHLNGSIPDTLASISSLTDIRLAYNNLSGQIPPQLFQVARYNFSGNNLTCGANFLHPCASNVSYQGSSRGSKIGVVLGTIGGVMGLLILGALFIICNGRRKSHLREVFVDVSGTTDDSEIEDLKSLLLDPSVIRAATDNFAEENKLGEGGFGQVYKGLMPNGEEIAVKKLARGSKQGLRELKNELLLVARLQHRNLVKLIGACLDGENKLLVYEYIPNKSLDTFVYDDQKREELTWDTRYRIICGIARGLVYLHEESRVKVIHRDLKPSNILLEMDMNPKISDFGLASVFEDNHSKHITRRVAGTYGYMAPEYAVLGHVSTKSDVFSFGVIVFEIVTGRRNSVSSSESMMDQHLLSYVWENWTRGTITEIVDPSLHHNSAENMVMKWAHIGLLCVQENPGDRPSMSNVVLMLVGRSTSLPAPSRPAFLFRLDDSIRGHHEGATDLSLNKATITELEPR